MRGNFTPDGGDELIFRVRDLYRLSDKRRDIAVGEFYSPRDAYLISNAALREFGSEGAERAVFFGGFEGAERKKLFILPEDAVFDDGEYLRGAAASEISLLQIKGSGYETLSHRDFMGALLGLGIKCSVLGDIVCSEECHGAFAFCDVKIADFIVSELTSVGRDRVSAEIIPLFPTPVSLSSAARTERVSFTVASMRADAVVSALSGASREGAKAMIAAGKLSVNYSVNQKPDAEIAAGDIISLVGFGKYIIVGSVGETRRGRLRVAAEKYI
ncbi:MAG: YlmH/Sll1252 family protein [Clostridiales bacterium]|nr:YlmH/Sll1252 family protein [Clostridiales bacterium]